MSGRQRPSGAELKGMRSCIGCRQRFPRETLVRLVLAPDGTLAVDRYLKAPGRGAHVCYSMSCIESVQNSKVLSRAFKKSVPAADAARLRGDILASTDARITDLLSIGRRAGWTVSGTDTLMRSSRRLKLLILATDAADDSKRKLLNAVVDEACIVVTYGDADHLGRTQMKDNRVAIGVSHGTMATRLKLEIERRNQLLVAT